jgi:hypothetical protein
MVSLALEQGDLDESASARQTCSLSRPERDPLTFVGRYSDIISETLAVCCCTAGIPLDLLASPFGPMGESMAIGVEAMGDSWQLQKCLLKPWDFDREFNY